MADPNSPDGPKGIYVLPEADVSGIKRKFIDVPYAYRSGFQKLDIYLPETGPAPYPVIVSVHGGAWMMCDKNDVQLSPALKALDGGFAVVSVNYRLSGEAKFPAQIHDVKAAIRWIRAHAAEYGFDPDRLAVWGGSAGGHLSEFAGTGAGVESLEDLSLGNPEESSAVDSVVAWFAPTDFLKMDGYFRETGAGTADHSDAESPESRLLGRHIVEVPDLVRAANPETWIDAMMPCFLLQHGTADPIVPFQHSKVFAENIRKVRGDTGVVLDLIPGAKHGGSPEFETPENVSRVTAFIRNSLDAAFGRKHFKALLFESSLVFAGDGLDPDAGRLLGCLRRRGVRTALVSTIPGSKAQDRTPDQGSLFDAILDGETLAASNPGANPYLLAASLLGVPASDSIALCITPSALDAAKAAGLLTVEVSSASKRPGSDYTIESIRRFVADRFFRQSPA